MNVRNDHLSVNYYFFLVVVLVWMSGLTFPGTSPYVRIVKKNSSSLLKLAVYFCFSFDLH